MNKNLTIYFCFPFIGISEAMEWAKKYEIKAKSISFGHLLIKERSFTQEEKDEYDQNYILGYSGFCRNGKEPTKKFINPDYNEDQISYFRKEVEDYNGNVFLDFNKILIELAFEYTDDIVFILPERCLKFDIIGRKYCEEKLGEAYILKTNWDKYQDEMEGMISKLNSETEKVRIKVLDFDYSLLDYVHDSVI